MPLSSLFIGCASVTRDPGRRPRIPRYLPARPRSPQPEPRRRSKPGDVVALTVTALVSAGLLLLLASYNLAVALPVALGYGGLVLLLWSLRKS